MPVPKTLNGYPVIEAIYHANCATVMMHGPDKIIVATWWEGLKDTWSWGHYFNGENKIVEAAREFQAAAGRNTER